MSIGQAIASSGGLKLAAGGLAAALALGGGAMATGHVSCETTVPTEVQGNLLVETGLDGDGHAQVETRTIDVEGLGLVEVAHSDVEVEVLGVQLKDGASAEVRSQNQGVAEVHFTLDGVVRTLLVSVADGELLASMAPTVSADASVTGDAAIEAEADPNADGALGIEIDVDAASAGTLDADSESDLLTGVNADGDINISDDVDADGAAGTLGGLGLGGDASILGGFGIDAGIDN